jgi:hypothetical protein
MDAGRKYATNTWPSCGEIDIMFKGTNLLFTVRYIIQVILVVMEIVVLQLLAMLHLNFTFTKPSGLRFSKIYVDDVLFHVANTVLPFNKDFS